MSDQNKATARRFYEEVISQRNVDLIDELITPDYQDHDPVNEEDTRGADGVKQEVSGYLSAFPDLQATVEDQLAEGDQVATRWSMRGKHGGDLMGIPPTNNQIEITGTTIFRFADDGKIQEGWWSWDALGLMRQVGAIPAEQPA